MREMARRLAVGLVVVAISLATGVVLAAPLSLQVDRNSIDGSKA